MKGKLFALVITACISGCQNEPAKPASDSLKHTQDHTQLLQTKRAILALDTSQVSALAAQIDVNTPLPDQSSLLAWAIETQSPELVEILLEQGAKVQQTGENRFSPIIQACRYGNARIINLLLKQGASPEAKIEDGTSALHLCAGTTSADTLSKMLSMSDSFEINSTNEYGQTPLMFAANAGNVSALLQLINAGADINRQTLEGYSPLFFAIKSQHLATVKAVIAHGADVLHTAQDGTSATQLAMYTHNFEFLTWYAQTLPTLMTQEAIHTILTAYDRDGEQLLHKAVSANQAELVSELLKLGANPASRAQPSSLTWRYEANFKTESYQPPQLTPLEIAQKNKFDHIVALLKGSLSTI